MNIWEEHYFIHNWVPVTIERGKKEAPGKTGALIAIGSEGQCEINKQINKESSLQQTQNRDNIN